MPSCSRHLSLLVVWLLATLAHTRSVDAAITATMPEGGTRGDWAMLTLEFPALKAAGEIRMRDHRGGMEVIRPLAAGTRRTTLSMPLMATMELPNAQWSLDITLLEGGTTLEKSRLDIRLQTAPEVFRVAIPIGTAAEATATLPWKSLTQAQIAFVELPEEDFLESPPIIFSACDALLLPPALRARLSKDRQLALVSAGVQLIVPADAPTTQPPSPPLAWRPVTADGTATPRAWIAPPIALRRPAILSPNLSQVALPEIAPDTRIKTAMLLLAPAAIVAALIARGLFKKPLAVHIAVAGAMVAVAAAFVGYLAQADAPIKTGFHLREAAASSTGPGGGIMLDQQYFARGTLLRGSFDFESPADSMILPQFAAPRTYFAAPAMRLLLSDPPRLQGEQAAREMNWFVQLSATPMPMLQPLPHDTPENDLLLRTLALDPARAWWVSGGYLYPANSSPPAGDGILIRKWSEQQALPIAQAARAWEAVRLQGDNRYLFWDEESTGILNVVDFGPVLRPE